MSNIHLVAIDEAGTQVVLSSPGVQGPAGASSLATVTGTTYSLSEIDRSVILKFTSSTDITVTVPPGLSEKFDCMFVQLGAGQIIFSAGSGVTINSAFNATKTAYQYAVASLIPLGSDAYVLSGEVTA